MPSCGMELLGHKPADLLGAGLRVHLRRVKDLAVWQHDTDIPKAKARTAAGEISVRLRKTLKKHFQPYLQTAMPKAFEKIYGGQQKAKESCGDLSEEGVKLTWTVGKYRDFVVKALRTLEKVQKEKVGKSYLVEEPEGHFMEMAIRRTLRRRRMMAMSTSARAS